MRFLKSLVFATLLCVSLSLAGGPALAAEKPIVWKWASNNLRGNTLSQIYPSMIEHIKNASNGRLQIEIVYDGEGVSQSGVYDAVASGLVQMGDPYIGMGAKIPFAEVEIGLPACPPIADMGILTRVMGWGDILGKAYAELGVVRLGAVYQSGSYLISKSTPPWPPGWSTRPSPPAWIMKTASFMKWPNITIPCRSAAT